jgi:micrococcal nuclease
MKLSRLLTVFFAFKLLKSGVKSGRMLMLAGVLLLGVGGVGAADALVDRGEKLLGGLAPDALVEKGKRLLAGGEGERDAATVVRVSDGDTIVVRVDGRERRTRLQGVDAPESSGVRYGRPSCAGKAAKAFLIRRIFRRVRDTDGDGLVDTGSRPRKLTLISDPSQDDEDRYGRLIRVAKLRGHRRTLQEEILAAGYATVLVYDGRKFDRLEAFRAAQRTAKRHRRGVYASCGGNFNTAA